MRLQAILDPNCVVLDVGRGSKHDVLARLVAPIVQQHGDLDGRAILAELERREAESSTAIADGIAIPHGKLDSVNQLLGVLGRSVEGLEFDSIDGKPTHLVFMLVAPASSTGIHLKALARLSRLFRDALFRQRLIEAADATAMYKVITEEDAKY